MPAFTGLAREDVEMFQRFTALARQSLVEATAEARDQGHNFVGTEHQLLGVLRVQQGVAHDVLRDAGVSYGSARAEVAATLGAGVDADALAAIGIDIEAVRRAVDASFGPGALERAVTGQRLGTGGPPFTARARRVIELSLREALALKHNYIGTEHILLAIIREDQGVPALVLRRLAPDTDFRNLVLERLQNVS
jgi:ATP-dependent Clp protease ATP-binding subunit ClpA